MTRSGHGLSHRTCLLLIDTDHKRFAYHFWLRYDLCIARVAWGYVMKPFLLSLLLLCVLCFPATATAQQEIDPRCTKMRDKVGCTCAVQNGGNVGLYCSDRFKTGWCYPNRHLEGYVQCMHRYGRK